MCIVSFFSCIEAAYVLTSHVSLYGQRYLVMETFVLFSIDSDLVNKISFGSRIDKIFNFEKLYSVDEFKIDKLCTNISLHSSGIGKLVKRLRIVT